MNARSSRVLEVNVVEFRTCILPMEAEGGAAVVKSATHGKRNEEEQLTT